MPQGCTHAPLSSWVELYLKQDARRALLLVVLSARIFRDAQDSLQVQGRREENADVADYRAGGCGMAIDHA
eukprot:scaffold49629_cov70-Phaeocystis_antarctica.AAC.2